MYNVKESEYQEFCKALRLFEQMMKAELVAKAYRDYDLVKTLQEQRRHYKLYLT